MQRGAVAGLAAALRFDGVFWRRFAYLGCVYGPDWWKRGSPPVIAAIIFAAVGRNRRGAMANLRRILTDARAGEPDARQVRRAALGMFAEFAHCLTETLESCGPRPPAVRIDDPPRDLIGEALRAGRGVVLVTGHFGNWDLAAQTLRAYHRPFNVVMAHEANATTGGYAETIRARAGVRVLYADSSVFSSLNMLRALRDNEIVAIQLDRAATADGTRLVPFFGAAAPFPSGPFVLARLAGAPILPIFFPRLGRRHYGVRLGARVTLPRAAPDDATLDRAMRAVVAELEAMVREFPQQWFQFAPFWPADAVGSSAPLTRSP